MIRKRPAVSMMLGLLAMGNEFDTAQAANIKMSDLKGQKPPSLLDLMKKRERMDKIAQLQKFMDTKPEPQSKSETQPQSKPEAETKLESNSIKVKIERNTTGNDDDRKISLSVDGKQEPQVMEVKKENEECVLYFGKETAKISPEDYATVLKYEETKNLKEDLLAVVRKMLDQAKTELEESVTVQLDNYDTKPASETQNSGEYIMEFLQAAADLVKSSEHPPTSAVDGGAQAVSNPEALVVATDAEKKKTESDPSEPEKFQARIALKLEQIQNQHKTDKTNLRDLNFRQKIGEHNKDSITFKTTEEETRVEMKLRLDYGKLAAYLWTLGRETIDGGEYDVELVIGRDRNVSVTSEKKCQWGWCDKHCFSVTKTAEQFWSGVAAKEAKPAIPDQPPAVSITPPNVIPQVTPGQVPVGSDKPVAINGTPENPAKKDPSALLIFGVVSIVTAVVTGVGALIHRIFNFWGESKDISSPKKNGSAPSENSAATNNAKATPSSGQGFLKPKAVTPAPAKNNQAPNTKPPAAVPTSVANSKPTDSHTNATGVENADSKNLKARKNVITWTVACSGVLILAILITIVLLFLRARRVTDSAEEKVVKEKIANPISSGGNQSSKDPTSKQSESSDGTTHKPTLRQAKTDLLGGESGENLITKGQSAKDFIKCQITKDLTRGQSTKDLTKSFHNSKTAIFEKQGGSQENIQQEDVQQEHTQQEFPAGAEDHHGAEDYHQEPVLCSAQQGDDETIQNNEGTDQNNEGTIENNDGTNENNDGNEEQPTSEAARERIAQILTNAL